MATEDTKWIIRNRFPGFQTRRDPEKVDEGACVSGQNVEFNDGDKISTRKLGYETYPNTVTAQTETTKVHSIHIFRRRDGENILIKAAGSSLEYYDENVNKYVVIESGFTAGVPFGFADYNINTDQQSFCYLCNGRQKYSRWTGAKSTLTVAAVPGSTTITVADASGFPAPTGTIVMAGVKNFYSARTNTVFTLVGTADVTHAVGSAVVAGLHQLSAPPKGNILTANDNRVFVAGISAVLPAVYFSRYGDATDFVGASLVTDSTADAPGIFNLAEGGGGVNGIAFDENATYFIKNSLIYKATLTDALYTLTPLKPFDGKSQTTGGIGRPFVGENGLFFITPDKKIYFLTRLPNIDYPQLLPISHVIKTTVESLFFEKARGIVYRERAYIACSTTKGGQNNSVLVYDIKNNIWSAPITGFNVTDWAIYNNAAVTGTGDGEQLFFASNQTNNVFHVTTEPVDDVYEVQSSAVMNAETFGRPAEQKYLENFFLEGYISESTTLNISLLFNDNGFTQQLSGSIIGSQTDFLFNMESLNVFGSNPFGLETFGGQSGATALKKFRLYLKNTLRDIPFYSIQVQFSSDGENQQFEVLQYGFKVGIFNQAEKRSLYKAFS